MPSIWKLVNFLYGINYTWNVFKGVCMFCHTNNKLWGFCESIRERSSSQSLYCVETTTLIFYGSWYSFLFLFYQAEKREHPLTSDKEVQVRKSPQSCWGSRIGVGTSDFSHGNLSWLDFFTWLILARLAFSVMIAAGVHDYANYFLDKMSTHREWRRNRAFWQSTVDLNYYWNRNIFKWRRHLERTTSWKDLS